MQLRPVGPQVGDSWITFLLREGYTLDSAGSRLGRQPTAVTAPAGADLTRRFWCAFVEAAQRGGERLVARRQQQALRYIRCVRAQCGYDADPSLAESAGIRCV